MPYLFKGMPSYAFKDLVNVFEAQLLMKTKTKVFMRGYSFSWCPIESSNILFCGTVSQSSILHFGLSEFQFKVI